jgi:hypothetical protein
MNYHFANANDAMMAYWAEKQGKAEMGGDVVAHAAKYGTDDAVTSILIGKLGRNLERVCRGPVISVTVYTYHSTAVVLES